MLDLRDLSSLFSYVLASPIMWTVLVIGALLRTSHWLKSFMRMYNTALKLPGPSGHLLIGNMLEFQGSNNELFFTLLKYWRRYGNVFRVWIANNLFVVLSDPTDVKFMLSTLKVNNRPLYVTNIIKMVAGNGMLTLEDGKVYKSHKRKLSPMFYPMMLKNFHSIFEEKSQILCEKLSQVADGRTVDIHHYITCFTMDAICSTVVGCEASNTEEGIRELVEAFLQADEFTMVWVVQPWLKIPLLQKFFTSGRKLLRVNKFLNTFAGEIIASKMKRSREERNVTALKTATKHQDSTAVVESAEDDELCRMKKTLSLLGMLVDEAQTERDTLSVEDIKEEMLTLMFAGFATTAVSLSFLILLLGIHQEVQEEVFRELEEVFGSSPRSATTEDLSRLKTLERVLKETLRMFPAVPIVPRELHEDLHLPSDKVVPVGSMAIISPYLLHHDPKFYPDPESFIPDRWLPENSVHMNQDAYMPFGGGLRSCIGARYAMLQMKVASCHLLRQFKFTTSLTMENLWNISLGITLKFEDSYDVELQMRALGNIHS